MVSLRSIFYYKYDRSTQSFDPVALDGLNSSTLGILAHFSQGTSNFRAPLELFFSVFQDELLILR